MQTKIWTARLIAAALLFSGCLRVPENITPTKEFRLESYLGTWYEVARLNHRFERGLEQVTAEYSLREDGGVRVLNRGYSQLDAAWKSAEGRAYFVASENLGHLKVSFFGPFYGSYVIIEHDPASYSMVTSSTRNYLWLLARDPKPPQSIVDHFLKRAKELGFDTEGLIFPAPLERAK